MENNSALSDFIRDALEDRHARFRNIGTEMETLKIVSAREVIKRNREAQEAWGKGESVPYEYQEPDFRPFEVLVSKEEVIWLLSP